MTADALPAPSPIVNTGLLVAGTLPSASGNTFQNNGKQFLLVKNAGSPSLNVTIDALPTGSTASTPDGLTVTDRVIAVAGGAETLIGPFPPSIYNDASGAVNLTTSVQTDITIMVVEFTSNPN